MEVDTTEDYFLFIKDSFLGSKKKHFEFFYQEPNYGFLLSKDNVESAILTPVYVKTDQEELSFRGVVQTCGSDHLKLGLECFVKNKCPDVIVNWSVSVYNTLDDECVVLGDSKINLSLLSQHLFSSEIKVEKGTIEKWIQANPLILKWSIETLPSLFDEEAKQLQIGNIEASFEKLMEHLSNELFKKDEQNIEGLQNVQKEMLNCLNQQNDNEEKLIVIENQCLNLGEKLGQFLDRLDMQEQIVSRYLSRHLDLNVSSNPRNAQPFSRREMIHQEACLDYSQHDRKLKRSSSDSVIYKKHLSRENEQKHEMRELEYRKSLTVIEAISTSETKKKEQEFVVANTKFEKDIELESLKNEIKNEIEKIKQSNDVIDQSSSKCIDDILLLNKSLDQQKHQLKLNRDQQKLLKQTQNGIENNGSISKHDSVELKNLEISIAEMKEKMSSTIEKLNYNHNCLEQLEAKKESISKRAIVLDSSLKDLLYIEAFTEKTFKEDLMAIKMVEENLKEAEVCLQRLDKAVVSQALKMGLLANEDIIIKFKKMKDCFEKLAEEANFASTTASDLFLHQISRKQLALINKPAVIRERFRLPKTKTCSDVTKSNCLTTRHLPDRDFNQIATLQGPSHDIWIVLLLVLFMFCFQFFKTFFELF